MTTHSSAEHFTSPRTDLDLPAIAVDLDIAETTRSRQLTQLPNPPVDTVAALHRESVERLLAEIRAARQRLADGTYGICTGCREAIPTPRLELRPWAATCTRCGRQ